MVSKLLYFKSNTSKLANPPEQQTITTNSKPYNSYFDRHLNGKPRPLKSIQARKHKSEKFSKFVNFLVLVNCYLIINQIINNGFLITLFFYMH